MQPTFICPRCGSENIIGATVCRTCGFPLSSSISHPIRPQSPPVPKINKPTKEKPPTVIPSQKKTTGDKEAKVTKEKAQETEQNGLSKGAAKAHIATACILGVTLSFAIVGTIITYNQFIAVYNDYQARTRPYLVIQELQFYETSNGSVYLLIDVTNSGERPATNISIQEIQVCIVSENPLNLCKPLEWTVEGREKETIVYPGRINTSRIYIDRNDYLNISPTDKIMVKIEYSCGDKEDKEYKEYWYEASLRLRPNSDVWRIESEKGN